MHLILYHRAECHLCDEMRAVVGAVGRDVPFELEEVDVDGDPELAAAYGLEGPVLFVNGRKAFKYRVSPAALRARLGREPEKRSMPVLAMDAMGGDHPPDASVRGIADISLHTDIDCLLVGDEAGVQAILDQGPYNPERIAVLHARETIAMDEDAHEAVRVHKDSSLLVALRAVAAG